MVSHEDIKLAQNFRVKTNYNDLVLTSTYHLHWVPVISGRQTVMGYQGWLWSYGYDYAKLEDDIKAIYQGLPSAKELIAQYGIDYVVIDNHTQMDFLSNEEFFKANYQLFISNSHSRVYKI